GLVIAVLTLVSACNADSGERPMPTTTAAPTPPKDCWLGTWDATSLSEQVVFFRGVPALTFEGTGGLRLTVRRDDATLTYTDTTVRSTYNGHALRMVTNGELRFTWISTDTTFRYIDVTHTTLVNSLYQDDVKLSTQADTRQVGFSDIT